MKNAILKAGVSAVALGLFALPACLGGSSNSGDGGTQSTGDDAGLMGTTNTSPTSTSTAPSSSSGSSSGGSTTSDAAGSGSSSGGATGTGVALVPDPNGYLGPSSNSLGIQGAWYAYGDDWGNNGAPPGDCETKGMHAASACSSITFPPPGSLSDAGGDAGFSSSFPQSTPGTMCLSGTAAKVISSDYSNIFGIGIGLDLNNQGGVKMTYNATMNKVIGFSFKIAGIPTGAAVRVELPIPATDSAGSDSWAYTVMADGSYQIDLTTSASDSHALKPAFTPTGTQPPFDPTKIESIQFHVPTNTSAAITIPDSTRLCVSDFQAIVSGM